jgi:hypothetical protein
MNILITGTKGYIGARMAPIKQLRYLQRIGQIEGELFWNAR